MYISESDDDESDTAMTDAPDYDNANDINGRREFPTNENFRLTGIQNTSQWPNIDDPIGFAMNETAGQGNHNYLR